VGWEWQISQSAHAAGLDGIAVTARALWPHARVLFCIFGKPNMYNITVNMHNTNNAPVKRKEISGNGRKRREQKHPLYYTKCVIIRHTTPIVPSPLVPLPCIEMMVLVLSY
jgi:hypothetical protein